MPFPHEAQLRGAKTRGAQLEQTERNARIAAMARIGTPHRVIAEAFGLTRGRVWAIVAKAREREGHAA